MQILFEDGARRRELDVQVNAPAATVADLATALDPVNGTRRRLHVGDQAVEPDIELRDAGLYEGAVVAFGAPTGARPSAARREVVVASGRDAGERLPLEPGTVVVIGRDPACDLVLSDDSVSRRHVVLRTSRDGVTTVEDLGSNNGAYLGWDPVRSAVAVADDVPVLLGATQIVVRSVRSGDRPVAVDPWRHATPAGTIPFNRPPRPAPPPAPEDIRLPKPPRPSSRKPHFSLIAILSPLVMAGGMYLMLQSRLFLMFGLLSPILAIGRFFDTKVRGRKSARSENERYRRELLELQGRLRDAAAAERARRERDHPDPAEILRRVTLPSTLLWERRPDHEDFLHLRAGVGQLPWEPPVAQRHGSDPPPEELTALLQGESTLYNAVVPLDVSAGNVVGIVGDREVALALARSLLCQAATLHGPADLPIMVLAGQPATRAWDWAKWLPHTRSGSGDQRLLSGDPALSAQLAEAYLAANAAADRGARGSRDAAGRTLFVVVDDESLTEGRRAPVRNLLRGDGGPTAGLVVAGTADRLPALCTSVIQIGSPQGDARLDRPQQGERVERFVTCGLSDRLARECARGLARFEDPELEIAGAGLPDSVRLLPLLELEDCDPEAVLARWKAGGVDPAPRAPLGVGETGVFTVDLVADGPHGLVGGTTGAGKSELLRTLVAGLAATVDPDHLTFLLVDFKGGSAFDECALLPHTVGMVTDLDEHLAERALRCLEAELRHRERVLRQAGATDLPDYLRNAKGHEPLPRLLVIIDEFATLKAELPDFIDALVGVAQRGRSLGVHLLLATQRPQGAISENIKANTNLRIALRMQDTSDSNDVIGVGNAADIPRAAPGRAFVRLGPGEVVPIQSALSTGARDETAPAPVEVAPFVYGPVARHALTPSPKPAGGGTPPAPTAGTSETDLALLVSTIRDAFAATGRPEPRRPWPEPLPDELDLDAIINDAVMAGDGGPPTFVPVALADDPDAQSQYPVGWTPTEGNLLVYGLVGSGTTTALSSLALALARLHAPERLHLYVVDFGAGELAPLAHLPHCGGVVLSHERERQQRVVRMLRAELDRRRQLPPAERAQLSTVVTMVDGWPAFVADYQDMAGQEVVDTLVRICSDGPEVGLHMILTADRSAGITTKIVSTTRQRWAFKLADPNDYAVVGVRSRAVPDMVPGHALVSERQLLVHVGRPLEGLEAAVRRHGAAIPPPAAGRGPQAVRTLPHELRRAELGATAQLRQRPWQVPVGLAESDLGAAWLVAYEGEHALITGPPRSGKSSALLTVADAVLAAEPEAYVAAVATARSPLPADGRVRQVVDPEHIGELQAVLETPAPVVLVLIDDADAIEEKRLDPLGTSRRSNLLVVAAGRSDALRMNFKHWTRNLRRSKTGVLLQPDPSVDGEILGCRPPRQSPVAMTPPGRGYVVNSGTPSLAQLAAPVGPAPGR